MTHVATRCQKPSPTGLRRPVPEQPQLVDPGPEHGQQRGQDDHGADAGHERPPPTPA